MARASIDLAGQRFGRLTVKQRINERTKCGHIQWICICDCENEVTVTTGHLRDGGCRSCGCLQKEAVGAVNLKHGLSYSPEYTVWEHLKSRCYNENNASYPDYGGRGITVCEEWRNSFEAFYRDMGPRPSLSYSIERKNNEEGYCKNNCYWATRDEQNNNRRNTLHYEYQGKTKPLSDWCNELGVKYGAVYNRLRKGMNFDDAVADVRRCQQAKDPTMNKAIIHAGRAAPELKRLLKTLDSVGAREQHFMTDLVSTLRYEEDYNQELNIFLDELVFGDFYHYQLAHGNVREFKEYTSRFMDDTAMVSKRVIQHLHETLITRGLYDKDGNFPYEFESFDGRLISLRRL